MLLHSPTGVGAISKGGCVSNCTPTVIVASDDDADPEHPLSPVLEQAIRTDFALVHARYGDRHGNLSYEKSAQNFSPLCAAAGRVTIAEVEELLDPGELDPMTIHTPGIFVQHVVRVPDTDKRIEKRTVRRADA